MSTSNAGRALLIGIVVAAVAALVAFFVVADPLGMGGDLDRGGAGEDDAAMIDEGLSDRPDLLEQDAGGSLKGRYGEGELGAVRFRLLDVQDRQPLPDVEVKLISRTGGGLEQASGTNGVVLFAKVAPETSYRLEIAGNGHAAVTVQGVNVERGRTNDLGDILLGAHVVLRGRVLDGRGRPLPGSSVAVYTNERGMVSDGIFFNIIKQATNFPVPLEAATTDDAGWFALSSLDDGTYRLEARQSGYAARYETGVVVSKDRSARDMTIILGEGAEVSGQVIDENGDPVTGARVVAIKDGGRGPMGIGSSTLERDVAFTDAAGAYVVDTLTQGTSYRFGVVADEFAPLFEMDATEIEHKELEKDFRLVRGGTIQGRVTRKEDGQPLADARIMVAVGSFRPGRRGGRSGNGGEESEPQQAGTGNARTDEQGNFTLKNLLPGPVMSAKIDASGYVTFIASMWTGNGWPAVEPGEITEVVVEMEKGGVLEGKVTDGVTNQPIAGADVTLVSRASMWTGSASGQTDGEGIYRITGVSAGTYSVIAYAPGYAAPESGDESVQAEMPAEGGVVTKNVSLERSGSVTGIVADSRGTPVAGARVRTRQAPAEGGGGRRGGRGGGFRRMMNEMLPGGSGADLTDQDGRFLIEDVSSDRRWIVEAEADDYVASESKPFNVRAGETKDVKVELSGGGAVEGRVVDDRGAFVAGARVRLGHLPSDRAGRVTMSGWEADRYLDPRVFFTDENGKFTAENLKAGTTLVKVEREDFVTYYKRNLIVKADETYENYVVSLTRGDTMEGRVYGADGKPIEGAWVGVSTQSDPLRRGRNPDEEEEGEPNETIEPSLAASTDADGKFVIENVPPGMYTVLVWRASGHQTYWRTQNDKSIKRQVSSSATTVDFRLEASVQGQGGMPGRRGGG